MKRRALALACEVGPGKAARRLGIPVGTVTGWRWHAKQAAARGETWPRVDRERRQSRDERRSAGALVEVVASSAMAAPSEQTGGLRLVLGSGAVLTFSQAPAVEYLSALLRATGYAA